MPFKLPSDSIFDELDIARYDKRISRLACKALHRVGLNTIDEVAVLTDAQITAMRLAVRSCGPKTANEITKFRDQCAKSRCQ